MRSTTMRGTGQTLTPRTEQLDLSKTVWAVLPSISLPTAERFLSPTTTRLAPTSSIASRIASAGSLVFPSWETSTPTPATLRSAVSSASAEVGVYTGLMLDSPRLELTTRRSSERSLASSPARARTASPSGVGTYPTTIVMIASQMEMDGQPRPVGRDNLPAPTAVDEPGHEAFPAIASTMIAAAASTARATSPSGGNSSERPTTRPRTASWRRVRPHEARSAWGSGPGTPPSTTHGSVVAPYTISGSSQDGIFSQVNALVVPRADATVTARASEALSLRSARCPDASRRYG